jgi:ABC-type antimicrobial peptide transport system permease subunit
MNNRRRMWSKSFLFIIMLLFLSYRAFTSASISGYVVDTNDEQLQANIRVIEGTSVVASFQTGPDGVFNLDVPPGNYTIIVYSNNPDTEGFDYVPASFKVSGIFDERIVLTEAYSLRLLGDFQFIDTENLPLRNSFYVQDSDGNILSPSGFSLEFSDRNGGVSAIPNLPSREVILPVGTIADVNVSSSVLIESRIVVRSFLIKDLSSQLGELVTRDVREYTIPLSMSIAQDSLEGLENRLDDMNQYGFYLARQEAALSSGIKYVDDSYTYFENSLYDESFDSLKRGYILFTHTNSELINMYSDARLSVYLLIGFLSVSAIVTGYLLFDDFMPQILSDVVILAGGLIFFYYTYPGSRTISLVNFVLASVAFFISFLGLGMILPKLFSSGVREGRVHTRNLIAPIFNIARRSIRRRKLRFLLTFISITLLVMSFVTLTSFSEGYGLITGETSPKIGWTGVFIREGSWRLEEPTFILANEAELDWLLRQPETDAISIKSENLPSRVPLLYVQGQPIFGILGVSNNETLFTNLQNTLIAGELPGENGVLVSRILSEFLQTSIGDIINIDLRQYTIEGIFDDELFRTLNDLDGSRYTPNKWVNISPEGEAPSWSLEETESNEILIMTNTQATRYPSVGVQRIAIQVNNNYNSSGFAERLALERGYLSWSNTEEAYSSFRLGNYFQGKGATLVIPWFIVVLNVIVTMLNSLYERRGEIEILSSVGLNPAQVSSIFIAEATITGFIAGGLGYLVGLGFYKALAILNIGLQVHQKVSAVWSIAAIALAISAVVTGAYAALRNSVVITPSLMRRWKLDRSAGGFQEPWRIQIPIKLEEGENKTYLDFVEMRLNQLMSHHNYVTSSIRRYGDEQLSFVYKSVQTSTGNFYTKNTLHIHQLETGEYGALLESVGEVEWVHMVGSLIRLISMDFSTDKSS